MELFRPASVIRGERDLHNKGEMAVDKRNRKWMIAAGIAAALVAALFVLLVAGRQPAVDDSVTPEPKAEEPALLTVVSLADVPQDVREAAEKLRSSRIGYAIHKPGRTYLIISTGRDDLKISLDKAVGQPAGKTPGFVDVFMQRDPKGESLVIATTTLPDTTHYQFALDGRLAAIPTLYNPHNLPLVHLDEQTGMVVLSPEAGQLVDGGMLKVWGYARPFEAQFDVRVVSAKGRTLGWTHVLAAGGAPHWGSFVSMVPLATENLPETGFVIFEEEMSGIRVKIPVRFRRPAQLG